MKPSITKKELTFKFFNYKWYRLPNYAKDTKHFYKKWYMKRYGYTKKSLKKFLENKDSILDAGCGLGRDSKFFSELNHFADIVAVDQSPIAVRVTKKYLPSTCKVIREDIITMKLKERFDFISCDQVIHHTPNPHKTLINLMRHLNKGGIINFSVCRKKNKYRDFADDILMNNGRKMSPSELWKFSEAVTRFGKALYDLKVKNIKFEGKNYPDIQRYVHDNLFRCWYNPTVSFDISNSITYDWFSGNPRFNLKEVKQKILKGLPKYKLLRIYEDDATISVSLKKL